MRPRGFFQRSKSSFPKNVKPSASPAFTNWRASTRVLNHSVKLLVAGGLVAWWNETAAIGGKAAKFQKRRTALAKRTASVKSALRAEERKFGAAVVRLLKTDAELRAVLLPKLQAALTNPQDKATLETLNGPARRVILARGSPVRSGAGRQTTHGAHLEPGQHAAGECGRRVARSAAQGHGLGYRIRRRSLSDPNRARELLSGLARLKLSPFRR